MVEFSEDQHGSRWIQQQLEVASEADKAALFNELLPHVVRLMVDVFGNYVIQKFLQHGSVEQQEALVGRLSGRRVRLQFQLQGVGGELFAFWLSPDPSGASGGYLGGGAPGVTSGVVDR